MKEKQEEQKKQEKGKTILIIDDHAVNLEEMSGNNLALCLLVGQLKRWGCLAENIHCATNLEEAQAFFRDGHKPSVIFLDHDMGSTTGPKIVKTLRETPAYDAVLNETIIIGYTSNGNTEDMQKNYAGALNEGDPIIEKGEFGEIEKVLKERFQSKNKTSEDQQPKALEKPEEDYLPKKASGKSPEQFGSSTAELYRQLEDLRSGKDSQKAYPDKREDPNTEGARGDVTELDVFEQCGFRTDDTPYYIG